MLYVAGVCALLGCGLLWLRFFSPGGAARVRAGRVSVVVYDGVLYRSYVAKRGAAGVEAATESGTVIYPYNVAYPHAVDAKHTIYIVGADRVALATHEALEAGRKTIAFKHIFKGGGDILFMLQMGASGVCLLVAVALWMQFGGVQSALNNQAAAMKSMQDTLSKPLVAAPAMVPGVGVQK